MLARRRDAARRLGCGRRPQAPGEPQARASGQDDARDLEGTMRGGERHSRRRDRSPAPRKGRCQEGPFATRRYSVSAPPVRPPANATIATRTLFTMMSRPMTAGTPNRNVHPEASLWRDAESFAPPEARSRDLGEQETMANVARRGIANAAKETAVNREFRADARRKLLEEQPRRRRRSSAPRVHESWPAATRSFSRSSPRRAAKSAARDGEMLLALR